MQEFLIELAKGFVTALAPVIAAALAAYLVQLARKAHLDVTAEQQAKFESVIRRAIQWAEEYYESRRKAGEKIAGAAKLTAAITMAQELGAHKSRDEIADAIHSKLAETPFGASSFPVAVPGVLTETAK